MLVVVLFELKLQECTGLFIIISNKNSSMWDSFKANRKLHHTQWNQAQLIPEEEEIFQLDYSWVSSVLLPTWMHCLTLSSFGKPKNVDEKMQLLSKYLPSALNSSSLFQGQDRRTGWLSVSFCNTLTQKCCKNKDSVPNQARVWTSQEAFLQVWDFDFNVPGIFFCALPK